jgi:hypothetical protein
MWNNYALQQHRPSGEVYVLRYNDKKTITGVCGPLNNRDREELQDLADCEFTTDDNDWANDEEWSHPIRQASIR